MVGLQGFRDFWDLVYTLHWKVFTDGFLPPHTQTRAGLLVSLCLDCSHFRVGVTCSVECPSSCLLHANLLLGCFILSAVQSVLTDCSVSGGLDLILVPGLAFTRSGQRLGRGKGYYDRYLHHYRQLSGVRPVTSVALAFKEQIFDSIPTSEHDVIIDVVLFDES